MGKIQAMGCRMGSRGLLDVPWGPVGYPRAISHGINQNPMVFVVNPREFPTECFDGYPYDGRIRSPDSVLLCRAGPVLRRRSCVPECLMRASALVEKSSRPSRVLGDSRLL